GGCRRELVGRRYGVMLVHDAPVAVYLAQADGEPEQEAILVRRVPGRVGTAAHDRDREGDVLARRHSELFDVESRSGLVIAEKQAPGLFVRLDPPALQRRRQVE